jgi:hypothetical protein
MAWAFEFQTAIQNGLLIWSMITFWQVHGTTPTFVPAPRGQPTAIRRVPFGAASI